MAGDDINIRIRLLEAARARKDALSVAGGLRSIGLSAHAAETAAGRMGSAVNRATSLANRGLSSLATTAKYGAAGIAGLAAAGAKWGLSFDAQVESSRLRFKLFTNDVDGLTRAVQGIDMRSAFNFGDLSDAAALMGNSGITDIPNVLQATANAAAASGKGLPALQGISVALAQIAAKGRLSQEEINQLNEAGAPGAQKIIQKAFHLTSKEVGNLGQSHLSSKKALEALTEAWTSGRMAKAAEDQTKTLGGQWQLLTGNMQKLSGVAVMGLASGLEHDLLPATNRAAQQITKIFGKDGLSNDEKLRQARDVIERELGPIWEHLKDDISEADIPGKLGDVIGAAAPKVIGAAGHLGVEGAKAFVHAWLHSDAIAQIASVLFIGNKLRKLGGGGGGRGGLGGLLGSSKPIPVYVVNKGFGGVGGGAPNAPARTGESWLKRGLKSLPLLAPIAAEAGLTEFINSQPTTRPDFTRLSPTQQAQVRLADRTNMVGRGGTGAGGQALYNQALAGMGPNLFATIVTQLDGVTTNRQLVRLTTSKDARQAGGKYTRRGPQGLPG